MASETDSALKQLTDVAITVLAATISSSVGGNPRFSLERLSLLFARNQTMHLQTAAQPKHLESRVSQSENTLLTLVKVQKPLRMFLLGNTPKH